MKTQLRSLAVIVALMMLPLASWADAAPEDAAVDAGDTTPASDETENAPAGSETQDNTAVPGEAKEAQDADATPDAEATPDEKTEAAERFRRGLVFYDEGDHALALIEFERAHQLVPDYRVLFNIGQVSIQLSRFAHARRALERYLEEGGEQLSAERRAAVAADLEMLAERTAHLVVRGEDGAQVFVDDDAMGQLPLAKPLLVDAGRHRLVVKKAGFADFEQRLTLAGAEELTVTADLSEVEPAPVVIVERPRSAQEPEVDDAPRAEPQRRSRPLVIAGWSTTGALTAAAVVTGVLGLSAQGELDELKSQPDPPQNELNDAANRANALFVATDVLIVSAIAVGGASLYFTLKKPKKSATASPHALRFSVRGASMSVSGRF